MTARATRLESDATIRPSACPGLFRIVPARDGGLCRLKVPLGRLTASGAHAIAEAAARYGNGIIEITNRANLQLRGIGAADGTALASLLLDAGLGPRHPDSDDLRNVMVSPTAGLDPSQLLDIDPLAEALLLHLETDPACRSLSPKFSLLVDGGEGVAVLDHPQDIWLAAMDAQTFALGVAGCPPVDTEAPFLTVPAVQAPRSIAAAIALFLDEAAGDPEITRIRHLTPRLSRDAFLDRLSKQLGLPPNLDDKARRWRRRQPMPMGHVGPRAQRDGHVAIGAVPPLGRLSPELLGKLGDVATAHGDGSLRLTPWQSVMMPTVTTEKMQGVIGTLESLGLICSPDHAGARTIACAGSSGCAKGRSDTKADAQALIDAGDIGGLVHLSGCERSCALASVAEVTLLAASPGRYDVFVKEAGAPHRFGRHIAADLPLDKARRALKQ